MDTYTFAAVSIRLLMCIIILGVVLVVLYIYVISR